MSEIKKLQIPLPTLEKQKKIVSKLDKFRVITEDFESGIPKLLNLVRKQYEYYKEEILMPSLNSLSKVHFAELYL